MNNALKTQFRRYFNKDRLKFDTKVFVFLFFVLVATIFWFLNALSKEYITDISCPVRYTNMPKDKLMMGKLPDKLTLKVHSFGFTLLKYKFSTNLMPVNINVQSLSMKRVPGGKPYEYYVLTNFVKDRIAAQLKSDIKIVDIKPDSLIFAFSSVSARKVPVKPVLRIDFEKQFMQNGEIRCIPDSVTVSGPDALIDTITFIRTRVLDLGKVNSSIKRSIALERADQLSYDKKRVMVEVPVEKYTEASLKLPLEAINLPDSISLKLVPREISLTFFVALSEYNRINVTDFRAIVDYTSVGDNIGNKLSVKLARFPGNVHSIKLKPKSVEYFIEKR